MFRQKQSPFKTVKSTINVLITHFIINPYQRNYRYNLQNLINKT